MKKLVAVFLAGTIVSIAGYTQTEPPPTPPTSVLSIKISGGVETGLYYQTSKIGSVGSIQLLDFDDTGRGTREYSSGLYDTGAGTRAYIGAMYDAGVYGFKATLRVDYFQTSSLTGGSTPSSNTGATGATIPYLSEGYAWLAPADAQLVFKIGAVTETSLSTGGDQGFLSFDATHYTDAFYGASFVIAPKNFPLSLGVLLPVDVNAIAGNAENILAGATVAAKLTIASVLDIVAGYTFADRSDADLGTTVFGSLPVFAPSPVSLGGAAFRLRAFSFGFDFLALPAFNFNAEGYIPFDAGAQICFDEKAGFTIGGFQASVLAYEIFPNGDPSYSAYLTFKPYIAYALDNGVTPGIYSFINTSNAFTWSVDPNVKFAVGSGTFLIGASIGTNVARNRDVNSTATPDIGANLYTDFEFLF